MFVRNGFAGLRGSFEVTLEDIEDVLEVKSKATEDHVEK